MDCGDQAGLGENACHRVSTVSTSASAAWQRPTTAAVERCRVIFPISPDTLFAILVTPAWYETPVLVQELATVGCNPVVLGILVDGSWLMYVVGTPPVVNAVFPASLASNAPFYVRCRG